MKWKWAHVIFVTVVGALVLIVVLQNTDAVETKILFVSVTMPRVVLLAIALVVGFWIGVIVTHHVRERLQRGESGPSGPDAGAGDPMSPPAASSEPK